MSLFSKSKEDKKNISIGEKLQGKKIHCVIVLEIAGRPADYIKKAMSLVVKTLGKEKGVEIISKKTHKVKKVETIFSTFAEIEMIVQSLPDLIALLFGYTPSSIEILEPSSLDLSLNDINNLLNDLASKIHRSEAVAKKLGIENEILKKHIEELKK